MSHWRNNFESSFDGEEDDEHDRVPSHTLRQALLTAASRFERDREREEVQLRHTIAMEKRKCAVEVSKLKAERERSATLETSLRDETAKFSAEREKATGLQQDLANARAQALGSYLLLASLRAKLEELTLATASAPKIDTPALPLKLESATVTAPTADEDAADEGGEGGEVDEGDEGGEGGEEGRKLTKTQKLNQKKRLKAKEKKAHAAEPADGVDEETAPAKGGEDGAPLVAAAGCHKQEEGDAEVPTGGLVSSEVHSMAEGCLELLSELPRALPSSAEFVEACGEGKVRSVESGMSPPGVAELLLSKAETALCHGLEASVAGGHIRIAKVLIEGGADAHRTEALHIAIRNGHEKLMQVRQAGPAPHQTCLAMRQTAAPPRLHSAWAHGRTHP